MIKDNKIWVGNDDKGENIFLLPNMANRHGLVAGATGTGKTVTLKVLAESFSDMGVPVFMADVKGDVAGMMAPGEDSENMRERIARFGLAEAGFTYQGYPVNMWDIFGETGIPLRTTISEVGPMLLARILDLNELQTDVLNVIFRIADDNNLLLTDTKDLKAMFNYVGEHSSELAAEYGKIQSNTLGAMTRAVVALEMAGGEDFFAEPALNINDWLAVGAGGKGMINILDSSSLINNGRLYATFLLWLLSELFEMLPEVGDLDKPKLVFFFDEAHLLFNDAPKVLLDKIEQVVKLIRSKGVGIYFCTQNPRDIPDGVLAQLNNKIEHALRAYTPAEQKAVKAAAQSFRENPDFDTYEAIMELGTGEAIVSFLDESGTPGIAQKAYILPPQSRMGAVTQGEREQAVKGSLLYSKYAQYVDNDSAYEFFIRMGMSQAEAQAAEQQRPEPTLPGMQQGYGSYQQNYGAGQQGYGAGGEQYAGGMPQQQADPYAGLSKEQIKELKKQERARKRAVNSVGNSVAGTIGREVGKTFGSTFGKFGKTFGGNVGASIGRGLFSTLFKR